MRTPRAGCHPAPLTIFTRSFTDTRPEVIPAHAGTQQVRSVSQLDPRLRGDDGLRISLVIASLFQKVNGAEWNSAWHAARRACHLLAILTVLVLAGCGKSGPEIAPVSGRVTLDGQPLRLAQVQFQPDEGKRPSIDFTDQDGRFELAYTRDQMGALVSWHTVRIELDREVTGPTKLKVPPRYNAESELRREVKSGDDNQFDFELTSNP